MAGVTAFTGSLDQALDLLFLSTILRLTSCEDSTVNEDSDSRFSTFHILPRLVKCLIGDCMTLPARDLLKCFGGDFMGRPL